MKRRRKKLTPWQKIVRACKRGTGLRLTRDEIDSLNMDDAICTRAALDDQGLNTPDDQSVDLPAKII